MSRELLASQADGSGAASLGADGHGASGSGRGAGTRRFSAWPDLGGGRFQGGASCGDGQAEGEKAGPGLLPRVPVPSTLASRGRVREQAEPAGAGACAHVELPDGFTQAQEWGAGGLPKEGEADATEAGHRRVGWAAGRERSRAEAAGCPRASQHLSTCAVLARSLEGAGRGCRAWAAAHRSGACSARPGPGRGGASSATPIITRLGAEQAGPAGATRAPGTQPPSETCAAQRRARQPCARGSCRLPLPQRLSPGQARHCHD